MKIAVTSQNFRTITGHAGKTRRFLVFRVDEDRRRAGEPERLDLPRSMSLHDYRGDEHPVFDCALLITGGCGEGFRRRMERHGVAVVATASTDPADAVERWLRGETLPPAEPHDHPDHPHAPAASAVTVDTLASSATRDD